MQPQVSHRHFPRPSHQEPSRQPQETHSAFPEPLQPVKRWPPEGAEEMGRPRRELRQVKVGQKPTPCPVSTPPRVCDLARPTGCTVSLPGLVRYAHHPGPEGAGLLQPSSMRLRRQLELRKEMGICSALDLMAPSVILSWDVPYYKGEPRSTRLAVQPSLFRPESCLQPHPSTHHCCE